MSNGREVVRTDVHGRYELPVNGDTIVFVIKPSGYAVPVERGVMLPRFYYIYQPEGTPALLSLRYGAIEPTGKLPSSIDFALEKVNEPTRFDVIMFADPHAGSSDEIDFIRDDVVNTLIGTKAAFGITAGDMMSDNLSFYERYNRIIGQIGVRWHNIVGNHDLNADTRDGKYSRETFKKTFGPSYYAFEHGSALFLMLDNVDYLRPGSNPTDGYCEYQGRFGSRQLAFVENVLKETPHERLVVAVMHIPLRNYLEPHEAASNVVDGAAFLNLLGNRPAVSFSGHMHTTEHHYLGGEESAVVHHHHVLTAVSGSWWSGPYDHRGIAVADSYDGSPKGFHILSVDGNRYVTHYQPAKEPKAKQVRILIDSEFQRNQKGTTSQSRMGQLIGSPISQDRTADTDLLVNVFDGGPRTAVEYRIGDHGPVHMKREPRLDPFVAEVYARNQARKSWVKAVACSHLWVARLPADLKIGTHCINVRVIDEYGRELQDHLVLEVTGATGSSIPISQG